MSRTKILIVSVGSWPSEQLGLFLLHWPLWLAQSWPPERRGARSPRLPAEALALLSLAGLDGISGSSPSHSMSEAVMWHQSTGTADKRPLLNLLSVTDKSSRLLPLARETANQVYAPFAFMRWTLSRGRLLTGTYMLLTVACCWS